MKKYRIFAMLSIAALSLSLSVSTLSHAAEWKRDDKGWWYRNDDGSYPTNTWSKIKGLWYYFDSIGYMVENKWIGDYYLGSDGAMLVSSITPDGYTVDENGKWVNFIPRSTNSSSADSSSSAASTGNNHYQDLINMGLSADEAELYLLINDYRASLGLKKLSFSKSLTTVARTHVMDSNANAPENLKTSDDRQGNLHSWSFTGNWKGVVYTSDHEFASLIWSKPSELTAYTGNGYEISAYSSTGIKPEEALGMWQSSPPHNDTIVGNGYWSDLKTMGVAISGSYAHVWFGTDADPAGYYNLDNYEVVYP